MNPAWSKWISRGRIEFRRLAHNREYILQSVFDNMIGLQFFIFVWSRSGFGSSVMYVRAQDGGGGLPASIELKRSRRKGPICGRNCWYHSYGTPSGPRDLRCGSARMTFVSSSFEKGVVNDIHSDRERQEREIEDRKWFTIRELQV